MAIKDQDALLESFSMYASIDQAKRIENVRYLVKKIGNREHDLKKTVAEYSRRDYTGARTSLDRSNANRGGTP